MSEEDDLDFTVGWALNALAEYGEDTQENIEKVYRAGDNYISKNKIRDKIKEIEEHLNFENTEMEDYAIAVLKELLEEKL